MESNNGFKTDVRLVNIINGGKHFLYAKDPEGLLQNVTPSSLSIDTQSGVWRMSLVFPSGLIAGLSGHGKDKKHIIESILLPKTGGQWEEIKLQAPSITLIKALGDLSRVPARLKQYLSREVKILTNTSLKIDNEIPFVNNARDAAFYKIEGGEDVKKQELFKYWRFNYILSEQGEAIKTEIVTKARTETGIISISVEADIYGLSNKKVQLVKKLGEDRTAVIECIKKEKNKEIPSLTAAFDLDKELKEIYPPEQRSISKRLPKPAKKS